MELSKRRSGKLFVVLNNERIYKGSNGFTIFEKKFSVYIILIKRGIKRGECLQPLVTVLSYFNIGSCFIHFLPIAL